MARAASTEARATTTTTTTPAAEVRATEAPAGLLRRGARTHSAREHACEQRDERTSVLGRRAKHAAMVARTPAAVDGARARVRTSVA